MTEAEERSTAEKLAALAAARGEDETIDPVALLVFIMALVQAWPSRYGALGRPSFADAAAQRATVVEAVRRLTVGPA
ncbi:hypothetical protein ABT294_29565 [Nonomuraea sp. NPDC000554]|uniref:hypothetical protein n=1 Tax=Nonomuraea sp. NPDC000554 TaxID=3154259 RepID=UPI0033225AB9